jgi:hypothetical protein
MMGQEAASDSIALSIESAGSPRPGACSPEPPTEEEVAAIMAVLMLIQAESAPVPEAPRVSAWARAGKREAVQSWTKQG